MPKVVDAEVRRSELMAATASTIASHGLEGVTMREVARAAGWTTGALSHYFADKDDLLVKTFRSRADKARDRLEALVASGRPLMEAVIESALPLDHEGITNWRVFLAFWGSAIGNPALTRAQRERHKSFDRLVTKAVRHEQEAGRIRRDVDTEREARRLVAVLNGISVQALFQPTLWTAAEQRRAIADHLAALR